MRPLLIFSAAIVSLILAVASAGMWIRSYKYRDTHPQVVYGPHLAVQSVCGRLCVYAITTLNTWPMMPGYTNVSERYPSGFQLGIDIWDHEIPNDWQLNGPHLVYGTRDMISHARWTNAFGFGLIDMKVPIVVAVGGAQVSGIVIPYWSLVVLFLILPLATMARELKRRARRRANHCIECGYDLRASTDKCPECGTSIPTSATAQTR